MHSEVTTDSELVITNNDVIKIKNALISATGTLQVLANSEFGANKLRNTAFEGIKTINDILGIDSTV